MSKKLVTRDLSQFVQEKRQDGIEIPWEGAIVLTLPNPAFWPKAARELGAAGDGEGSLRVIAGDEAVDTFVTAVGMDADTACNVVWALIAEELGLSAGESLASSTS